MLVQLAQMDAQLHNLHGEYHDYEQFTTLLVTIHNDGDAQCMQHVAHVAFVHSFFLLLHLLHNDAQFVVHPLFIK